MVRQQQKFNQKSIEMSQKKINLKKTFQELDDILAQLESADLDIDKMIKLYERGMVLTKACQIKINEAEQKIKIINETDDSSKD